MTLATRVLTGPLLRLNREYFFSHPIDSLDTHSIYIAGRFLGFSKPERFETSASHREAAVGRLLGFVTLFLLFFARPVAAQQQSVIFVNGVDPTCGGQAPCYTTIQDAVDAAQPGNIIRIQAGVYHQQVSIEKNKFPNATEFDRIVIEADPALPPGQIVITGGT